MPAAPASELAASVSVTTSRLPPPVCSTVNDTSEADDSSSAGHHVKARRSP